MGLASIESADIEVAALADRAPHERYSAELQEFYREIGAAHMTPLWENLKSLVPRTPISPVRIAHWDYQRSIRPHLLRAGALISAEQAERRVLVLENPGLPGSSSITQTLYAGVQLLLSGEVAPPHRHTQSALRLIIEGQGAYTTVDGERVMMKPGDFVITPGWRFHGHGNETADPIVWLDGLDIPWWACWVPALRKPARAAPGRPNGRAAIARFDLDRTWCRSAGLARIISLPC